jgi:signal transduction histidine kinase/ActR/RegA family two-component response regulator
MTERTGQPAAAADAQSRVIVLPPTRRDGEVVRQLLQHAGLASSTCSSVAELGDAIDDQAAAVLLTDDVLDGEDLTTLRDALQRQPQWSDVPFVVLAAGGAPSRALCQLQGMASVTLLDRSVHMRTLLSAVQMAVRARGRQYQIRDLLERERQARVEADRANEAKDRFLAVLSHELRTPLTPIVFAVAALQRELNGPSSGRRAVDARLPRMLEMISRNIALETKLIDDLLDLSRLVQGKLQLQPAVVDMHGRLLDTLAMVEMEARAKQLTVETAFGAERPLVMADPARIHQVLWNLLKNAIKFTPAGGTVRIATWNDGAHLVISCADTGIGIPAEALPRLFEPFEQGSAEITRHYGGLGLGLAVGRSLVVAHGGSLTARSEGVGKGATFTVMLPATTINEASGPLVGAPPPAETSDRRCLDILLVEDHEDTAQTLRESLVAWGHRVRVADAVGPALREAAADPCEVLISDIGLPDGSGVDLIRQIQPPPTVGAIAMSGFGMEEDLTRSRDAGFTRHLTKPVDLALLEQAIADLADPGLRGPRPPAGRQRRPATRSRRRRPRPVPSRRG